MEEVLSKYHLKLYGTSTVLLNTLQRLVYRRKFEVLYRIQTEFSKKNLLLACKVFENKTLQVENAFCIWKKYSELKTQRYYTAHYKYMMRIKALQNDLLLSLVKVHRKFVMLAKRRALKNWIQSPKELQSLEEPQTTTFQSKLLKNSQNHEEALTHARIKSACIDTLIKILDIT